MEDHYRKNQAIQEAQYTVGYHWDSRKKVTEDRYLKMTKMLSNNLVESIKINNIIGINILDFGCGDGRGSYQLWKILKDDGFNVNLVGVDISDSAIKWANHYTEYIADNSLSFISGHIEDGLDFFKGDERKIYVVMREVIEHLPENDIDNILRIIKNYPQIIQILITVPSNNTPLIKKHFRHYNREMLYDTLERNGYYVRKFQGMEFRPRYLCKILQTLKSQLNRAPFFWRLMSWMWRPVSPKWAITLFALGQNKNETN